MTKLQQLQNEATSIRNDIVALDEQNDLDGKNDARIKTLRETLAEVLAEMDAAGEAA